MLQLSGTISRSRVAELRQELLTAVRSEAGPVIEFDCNEMTDIDLEGAHMLMRLAEDLGRRIVLTDVTPDCRRRIELMGLSEMFGL